MNQKDFWKSKKWWMGVAGVLVPAANSIFGWGLTVAEVMQVITPLLAYVIGQGFADFAKDRGSVTLPAEKPFWLSKKFLTGVGAAAIPLVSKALNIELDPQVIYGLMAGSSAYITGQGLADFGKNAAPAGT